MSVGARIAERLAVIGMSQSELARRVSLAQTTINTLIRQGTRSSVHLHKIARVLGTTPAYLAGEIDDPDEGAPPPQPPAPIQVVLPVTLPPVEALERAYLGLLVSSRHMNEAELARELAVRLPRLLSVVQGPLRVGAELLEPADTPADDHRERRRA